MPSPTLLVKGSLVLSDPAKTAKANRDLPINYIISWIKNRMPEYGYNKSDLKEIRKIDESEIKELTSKYKLQYIETSAKTGDYVKSSFESLSKLLIIKNEELILKNKNEKKNTSANISIELKKDHSGKKKKNSKA